MGRKQTSTTANAATRPQAEGTRVLGPEAHVTLPFGDFKSFCVIHVLSCSSFTPNGSNKAKSPLGVFLKLMEQS